MLKCPFCQFDNEDGALFCEQCKSDLATVVSTPASPPAMPALEPVPMAAILDDPIPLAPMAEPVAPVPEAPMFPAAMPEPIPLAGWEPLPVAAMQAPTAEPVAVPPMEIAPVFAEPAPAETPPLVAPPAAVEAAVAAAAVAADAVATPAVAEPAPAAPTEVAGRLPADAKPVLVVIRGLKINHEFPIYPDLNFIGRADEKPVDIDLEDQEPPDRVWCSRQHALITFEDGVLTLEDLNSSNGTYVNRTRVYPGQKRQINVNDVIQIGTVQMKVKA